MKSGEEIRKKISRKHGGDSASNDQTYTPTPQETYLRTAVTTPTTIAHYSASPDAVPIYNNLGMMTGFTSPTYTEGLLPLWSETQGKYGGFINPYSNQTTMGIFANPYTNGAMGGIFSPYLQNAQQVQAQGQAETTASTK